MFILEIGCGGMPRPLVDYLLATGEMTSPETSPVMSEFIGTGFTRYVGVDVDGKILEEAQREIARLPNGVKNRITLRKEDATQLSFEDSSVDVVLLEDVLSAPAPDTCPVSEPYPEEDCIDDIDKESMLEEAVRVLKPGGIIIVGIMLTPCYATSALRWLERNLVDSGQLRLVRSHGEFDRHTDDWKLYHAAYQKAGGQQIEATPATPLTPEQVEYAEEYAASWRRNFW